MIARRGSAAISNEGKYLAGIKDRHFNWVFKQNFRLFTSCLLVKCLLSTFSSANKDQMSSNVKVTGLRPKDLGMRPSHSDTYLPVPIQEEPFANTSVHQPFYIELICSWISDCRPLKSLLKKHASYNSFKQASIALDTCCLMSRTPSLTMIGWKIAK